jgi:ATP-dependent helicase HrpA
MGTPPVTTSLTALRERLPELMLRDQRRLRRRLDGVRKLRDEARGSVLAKIGAEVDAAAARVERRRASVPAVRYPEALPVSQAKDEILAAIRDHQVVIVAGETGSGKTTQLPKICLELGRGVLGTIGHTQPRRLAARTVAERIAEELGQDLGESVGYKVRFTDSSGDRTLVKLMTDGILLAELQNDRLLSAYDTLIIDEAHERSLNIDFILGYLKQLLPRRPDLKVIITSATIDPERFARQFGTDAGPAPILRVSGRTYPVEVRYRPLVEEIEVDGESLVAERDQVEAIGDAVRELSAEGPGDILVFLSGEREIRDTAEALGKLDLRGTDVLPLYARLAAAEQHRVFQPHTGRRVVLATNVAETSLTVPGIRYVIDPGTARISRYSQRTKVQRLPIEPVSQASANQRKGRCGRVAEGICIRLYTEDDFESRPEFTDPEILRTNLASVILQMINIGLGDIAAFPFLDPPDKRSINDGVVLLHELGALAEIHGQGERRLTPLGKRLAQLPVDPRLGRMVLAAADNGCVREVLVIAAALSIQDPRERPAEHQQAAGEKHARFADPDSDFLAYLNLWNYLREQQRELSGNRFRRLCKNEFLNYLRVREWQDLHGQLRQIAAGLDIVANPEPAPPQQVHLSLLAGLLSHLGLKEGPKQEYQGARGAKFAIFPGSALFRKQPRWVIAAELVETSRLWGRIVARIEPEWAESLAAHLVKHEYSEPHWESRQGAVIAYERVTLYGLPIVTARKVNYGKIDPEFCRAEFIRHALVEGDWRTPHKFFQANRKLLDEVGELENRARRRDILVDDERLFEFYDQRIGAEVTSARHFDSWWKQTRREQPHLLDFDREMLVNSGAAAAADPDSFPDSWQSEGLTLPLSYAFEPGAREDGVTVHVPLPVLNQVTGGFDWQIPGLREELVTALIRALPKAVRRNFVPAPDFAKAALTRMTNPAEPLLDALERALRELTGVRVGRADWDLDRVPEHLKMTFRVTDERGTVLAEGKDPEALRDRLRPKLREALTEAGEDLTRTGLTTWTVGTLPRTHQRQRRGYQVTAYPALVDEGATVGVRMFETAAEAQRAMWLGTRRLLLLETNSPVKQVTRQLSNQAKLVLGRNPHGGVAELLADCIACAADAIIAEGGGPAWTEAGYAKLRDRARTALTPTTMAVLTEVQGILTAAQDAEVRLGELRSALPVSLADLRAQLTGLVHKGFVAETGFARLPDVRRYLLGVVRRVEKLPENPRRDAERTEDIAAVTADHRELAAELPPGADRRGLDEIRWMIEELRISFFAQTLGTPQPVSVKRIHRAMDDVQDAAASTPVPS